VTVLEVIQRSTEYLAKRGVDSPRLQIELLLAHVLQLPRLKLYLNFERPLADGELATLRELVRRRGEREPLQHLVGTACFFGLEFEVNRDVLIPRPETEVLVEHALQQLSTRASRPARVLDLGTGSGCLAITLAVKAPAVSVHATDLSEAALTVARRNAARHGVAGRIEFCAGDGFAAVPDGLAFDLCVSNPPYIPSGEIGTLEPEVRDFDPRAALDGGADGLDFFRRIAAEAPGRLRRDGVALLELGDGQAGTLPALFATAGWRTCRWQRIWRAASES
jgi:release factor glutamine methyltransferase